MTIFISAALIPITFWAIQRLICEPLSNALNKFAPGRISTALTKKRFE